MKPFNCSLPVLCLSFSLNWNLLTACHQSCLSLSFFPSYLPHQYTGLHNPTVKQQMPTQQSWDYLFYTSPVWPKFAQTPPHQRRDAWPTNCTPKDAHASVFFYTSSTPHARHIRTHFELWGRPFCSSLLASFFLSALLWKEFNSHSFIVTFHFSRSFGSPPVFYPARDGC